MPNDSHKRLKIVNLLGPVMIDRVWHLCLPLRLARRKKVNAVSFFFGGGGVEGGVSGSGGEGRGVAVAVLVGSGGGQLS